MDQEKDANSEANDVVLTHDDIDFTGFNKYNELFEKLAVGFYRTTPDGKLLSANRVFLQMIGYTGSDKLTEVSLPSTYSDPDGREKFINEIEQRGEVRARNAEMRKPDGSLLDVEEFAVACYNKDKKIAWYEGFVVEITGVVESRRRISFLNSFRLLVTRLSVSFLSGDESKLEECILSALEETGNFIQADRAYVCLFSNDRMFFSNTYEWCREEIAPMNERDRNFSPQKYVWLLEHLQKGLPVQIPVVEVKETGTEMLPESEAAATHFNKTHVAIPLYCEANLLGFLGFDMVHSSTYFDTETFDILKVIAGLMSAAIQRQSYAQQLAKHHSHLEQLVSERTAKLELAEAKYRLITTNSHDVIWTMDKNMKTTFMSPSVEKHLGYTVEEYLSLSLNERLPAESYLKVKTIVADTLAKLHMGEFGKDEAVVFEMLHKCKDGTMMWGEVSFILLFDDNGAISGFHGVTRNIHKRKLVERELHESREQFKALIENTSDWIWEVDHYGCYTYSNPVVEKILGYKPEEVIGRTYLDFIDPVVHESVMSTFLNFRDARISFQKFSYTAIHRNGKKVHLEKSGIPVHSYDGAFTGFRGIDRDVTESALRDMYLRQTQFKLRQHINNTSLGYIEWDLNKEVIEWNQSAARIFGYSKMQAISDNIFSKVVPDELTEEVSAIWNQIIEGMVSVRSINDNLNSRGERIKCCWHNTPLLDDKGGIIGVASLVEDITSSKQELKGNQYVNQTFEQWESGVVIFLQRFKILAANAAARSLLGISETEANDRKLSSFFDPEEFLKLRRNLLPLVVRNKEWKGMLLMITTSGIQLVRTEIQRHIDPKNGKMFFIMMMPAKK